ncbi:VWA domain-containing protein [Candidatus Woesearchaeota archaeon]|nr:VWA domain-containing protein [Candidatus Woesearchaeota archaeon]
MIGDVLSISNVLKPQAFLWLAPILILFFVLLFKDFVKDDFGNKKEKKKFKRTILITRLLIFILLVIVLAKPFGEVKITTPGNPKLTLLIDNTTSMSVMDADFISELKQGLEKQVPVSVKTLGSGLESDLADSILTHLEKDTNLLLITDGNVNQGTELGDVALLAANLNSTISAIDLKEKEKEAGVYISGPESSVAGVNNTYVVKIINLGDQEARLRVVVDDEVIINEVTKKDSYVFEKEFGEGDHRITAEVDAPEDYFDENNAFYKSVGVVKKPKILLVSDAYAPIEKILKELYDVTKVKNIPDNVNDYYAVIIYDKPAGFSGVNKLADYLVDKEGGYYGNGLFVIGGFDSFDRGSYKGSLLESYLPVYVGKAARRRGSSNIVLSIDFSGSSGDRYEVVRDPQTGKISALKKVKSDVQDVEKALAVSVIKSLGPDNNVGATIFSTQSAVVQELQPLFLTKEELINKVSRIQQPPGQSFFHIGLSGAYNVLKNNVGTNNIIMITDGNTGSDSIRKQTLDTAKTINARGVKVYIVGTGRNVDESFLKSVAHNGGGIYFPAAQENRLKILFGEPEESKFGELFDLFMLNPYHFITQNLELDASLYGFNQVIPKSSAQLLVTTQHGEPALTVWNYGLGRVASLNVFSGNNNLGDLLNKRNSILLTRTINWVIGDPQRKEPYYVVITDSRTNEPIEVIVKSDKYPSAQGLSFTRIGENQYKTLLGAQEKGFNQVLSKNFAVNYETEYQALGMNQRLEEVVSMSGGKVFKPSDIKGIVEFVKSASKQTKVERTTIIWPFLLLAVIIFLIEIGVRKTRERKLNK